MLRSMFLKKLDELVERKLLAFARLGLALPPFDRCLTNANVTYVIAAIVSDSERHTIVTKRDRYIVHSQSYLHLFSLSSGRSRDARLHNATSG